MYMLHTQLKTASSVHTTITNTVAAHIANVTHYYIHGKILYEIIGHLQKERTKKVALKIC